MFSHHDGRQQCFYIFVQVLLEMEETEKPDMFFQYDSCNKKHTDRKDDQIKKKNLYQSNISTRK